MPYSPINVSNQNHICHCLIYIKVVVLVVNTSIANNMQSATQNPSCDIHQMCHYIDVGLYDTNVLPHIPSTHSRQTRVWHAMLDHLLIVDQS